MKRKPSKTQLAAALLSEKPAPELSEHEKAYHAAVEADSAWQLALVEKFGGGACNARFEPRGKSTPKLKRLYEAKRAADDRLAEAWRELRLDQSTTQPTTQSTVLDFPSAQDLFK